MAGAVGATGAVVGGATAGVVVVLGVDAAGAVVGGVEAGAGVGVVDNVFWASCNPFTASVAPLAKSAKGFSSAAEWMELITSPAKPSVGPPMGWVNPVYESES